MDFKDYDFFAWMEAEKIPKAPPIENNVLPWSWTIVMILIYLILFVYKGGFSI